MSKSVDRVCVPHVVTRAVCDVGKQRSHKTGGISSQPLTRDLHLHKEVLGEMDLVRGPLTALTQVIVPAVSVTHTHAHTHPVVRETAVH